MGSPLGSSLCVCIRTRSDRRFFLKPCFLVPSRTGYNFKFLMYKTGTARMQRQVMEG